MAPTVGTRRRITLPVKPLTSTDFAPFGTVVTAPLPANVNNLPYPPPPSSTLANQHTALRYSDVAQLSSTYRLSPSGSPPTPHVHLFSCFPQPVQAASGPVFTTGSSSSNSKSSATFSAHYTFENYRNEPASSSRDTSKSGSKPSYSLLSISLLERHPYTTQTLVPMLHAAPSADSSKYVVVVAPALPIPPATTGLTPYFPQQPQGLAHSAGSAPYTSQALGGMPDLDNLRAFVVDPQVDGAVGVTYGVGVWHAPITVVGDSRIDFLVTQWSSGREAEDVQEVHVGGGGVEVALRSESVGQEQLQRRARL